MMRSTKMSCFALLLLLCLLMVGCSEEKKDSSASPTPTPTEAATPTPTSTPEPTATSTPEPTPTEALMVPWDTSNVDTSWIDPNKKLVAFTFDDGPTQYYDELLDILKENGAHATFFVWGNNYKSSFESVVKRVVEEGSELGNHTWSHPYLTKLDEDGIRNEIEKTRALLESITGIERYLVRPPYGSSNMTVQFTVKTPLINWSVDSADWNGGTYDSVYNKVMSNLKDGDIVLMHANYSFTVDAVRDMIPELMNQGYQIVSVSELLAVRGKELTSGTAPLTSVR